MATREMACLRTITSQYTSFGLRVLCACVELSCRSRTAFLRQTFGPKCIAQNLSSQIVSLPPSLPPSPSLPFPLFSSILQLSCSGECSNLLVKHYSVCMADGLVLLEMRKHYNHHVFGQPQGITS